jgi:hypothetical protein
MIDATKMLTNPLFYIKLGFIGLAVVCGRLIWTQVFQNPMTGAAPVRTVTKWVAAASLACWLAAITAGRLTAYLFTR